jgi:hypothetical protein
MLNLSIYTMLLRESALFLRTTIWQASCICMTATKGSGGQSGAQFKGNEFGPKVQEVRVGIWTKGSGGKSGAQFKGNEFGPN